MAPSYTHAEASARKFGGKPEDYLEIHEFIDRTKQSFGDVRHRALLHNTFGPWVAQEVFGRYIEITTKTGRKRKVTVREIAESHIIEDLGCIPSVGDWLSCMECKSWMGGKKNKLVKKDEFLNGEGSDNE